MPPLIHVNLIKSFQFEDSLIPIVILKKVIKSQGYDHHMFTQQTLGKCLPWAKY